MPRQEQRLIELLTMGPSGSINATEYKWDRISGAEAIVAYGKDRKIMGQIEVEGRPKGMDDLYYGGYYEECTEGVRFTDGTCLVCATLSQFADTASSNDLVVKYFILKPHKADPSLDEWNKPGLCAGRA